MTTSTLALSVPKALGKDRSILNKNAKDFGEFVLSLPFNDIPSALLLALKKLESYNRTNMSSSSRILATAPFNFAVGQISDYYRGFNKSSRYLRQLDENELDMLLRLNREMGYGYKHVLNSYLSASDQSHNPHTPKEIGQYAYMALFYLGQQMLVSYDLFRKIPQSLWREVNAIYSYCEVKSLLHIPRYNPIDPEQTQNIHDLFVKIQLVSLADPYHLSPGEIWTLSDYVDNWTDAIDITASQHLQNKNYIRINITEHNRAHNANTSKNHNAANSTIRWLAMDSFHQLLESHIQHLENGNSPLELGLEESDTNEKPLALLERLSLIWQADSKRLKDRIDHKERIRFVWGLSQIHSLLTPSDPSLEKPLNLSQINNEIENRAWADTENISATGACIRISDQINDSLVNGQIVAIVGSRHKKAQIGIIRWINKENENECICGIKIIRGTAKPVLVKPHIDDLAERQALMMAYQSKAEKTSRSLIAPLNLMSSTAAGEQLQFNQASLELIATGDSVNICATKLLLSSTLFEQLDFERVYKNAV